MGFYVGVAISAYQARPPIFSVGDKNRLLSDLLVGILCGDLDCSGAWPRGRQAGQLAAAFIWPPLSDRIGRKKLLVLGQLGLSLPFVLFGMSRNYGHMARIRARGGPLGSRFGTLSSFMLHAAYCLYT
jgi:hypothetical protein